MTVVHSYTLRNGCRVLVRPTPDKRILSMLATVAWGSRDDAADKAGRANLMARLLVKGTKTRTAFDLAKAMESVGGAIDPFCGYDSLGIETQSVETDWRLALELLGDSLFNPSFKASEFEKERGLVETEILRAEDDKLSYTYKHLKRLFYRGHPYETQPEGEVDTVGALRRGGIVRLHRTVVRPDRILLVIVGNVPEEELLSAIEAQWPGAPGAASAAPKRRRAATPPGAGRGETIRLAKEVEQGFVVVGYGAPRLGTPESTALRVACAVLGEGMSARLFARLRDRDHLAYAVGSTFVARDLDSHLLLYIGTKPENVARALEAMVREARAVAEENPSEQELARAKRYILGKYLIAQQTNAALARSMSAHELMGLGWQWGEGLSERLRPVTAETARETARRYLTNPAVAILEPRPGA
jgi:zinc protease